MGAAAQSAASRTAANWARIVVRNVLVSFQESQVPLCLANSWP